MWTLLLAILSFAGLLEFGVIQAANKEIAYALSKGDLQMADRYKRVQFSFVGLTALLGSASLVLYACLQRGADSDALALGLLAVAAMLPISQLQMGQVTVFWANKRFSQTGRLIVFETLLAGSAGLFLVWRFGLAGQVAAFLAILLVKVGVLAWPARKDPRLRVAFGWDLAVLKRLLRVGVPLQIINLNNVLKLSGTVFLISYFFDTRAVGLYSLALSVQNFIYWTPNAFSIVMFPRFQERFAGSSDKASALHSFLVKPTIGLGFFLLPLLVSLTYFLVPPLIDHALPSYHGSIPVIGVMLVGTFWISLEHMPGQFLTTTNRLWERVVLASFTLVLLAACLAVAVALDCELIGFVAALSVANALSLLLVFAYAYALAGGPQTDRWFIAKLVAAFAYLITTVAIVDRLAPATSGSAVQDLLLALLKWLVAAILMIPIFAVAERQLGLIRTFRQLARGLRAQQP